MICPDCTHDNIDGVDDCAACGQPLVLLDPAGGELEQSITRHTIAVLCPKTPLTVTTTMPTSDALALMVEHNVGCLLIVDDHNSLTGIFSERDVLTHVSSNPESQARSVVAYMTEQPVTARQDDSIAFALHAMHVGGYRHLPIVDEAGCPQGIVSVRDILRFICVRFGELRSTQG